MWSFACHPQVGNGSLHPVHMDLHVKKFVELKKEGDATLQHVSMKTSHRAQQRYCVQMPTFLMPK